MIYEYQVKSNATNMLNIFKEGRYYIECGMNLLWNFLARRIFCQKYFLQLS